MRRVQAFEPEAGRSAPSSRRSFVRNGATAVLALTVAASLAVEGRATGQAPDPPRTRGRSPAPPPGTPAPIGLPRSPTLPAPAPTPTGTGTGTETPPGTPAPAASPAPAPAEATIPQVSDLSTRYRFLERYATELDRPAPGEIGQYRVASRDVIRVVTDKPQGSPERTEQVVQVIYTERATGLSGIGQVTDTVRRYDAFRTTPTPQTLPSAGRPLEGLVVWYKSKPGGAPEITSLVIGRALKETEYGITRRQIFMPDLAAVLPTLPSRVGDRWRVPRLGAHALLGERPLAGSEPLIGTLQNVQKAASGPGMVATIGITGRVILAQSGETMLNAQVRFDFTPGAADPVDPAPASGTGTGTGTGAEPMAGVIDARGAITELRLARAATAPVPGSNGRLKANLTWELTLNRQLGTGAPLAVASQPPAATEANAWLTYDDPKGRFHFRHPQAFLPQAPPFLAKDDLIQLGDAAAGSDEGRIITIRLQSRSDDPAEEKANRDPESHLKELNDEWVKSRQDVIRGPSGWLPDAEWAPFRMRVYRIEAALKPKGPEGRDLARIYLDYYLALFTQNESLVITAMTGQDPPLPFRKDVEAILKTFQLGASKPTTAGGTAVPPSPLGTAPVVPPEPVITPRTP